MLCPNWAITGDQETKAWKLKRFMPPPTQRSSMAPRSITGPWAFSMATSFASTPVSDFFQLRGGSEMMRSPSTRTPGIRRQNSSSRFPAAALSRDDGFAERRLELCSQYRARHRQHFVDRLRQPVRLDGPKVEPACRFVEPAKTVDQRHGLPHQAGESGRIRFAGTARRLSADAGQSAAGRGFPREAMGRPRPFFDARSLVASVRPSSGRGSRHPFRHVDGGHDGRNLIGQDDKPPILTAPDVDDLKRDGPMSNRAATATPSVDRPTAVNPSWANSASSCVAEQGKRLEIRASTRSIVGAAMVEVFALFVSLASTWRTRSLVMPNRRRFGQRVLSAVLPTVIADEDIAVPLEWRRCEDVDELLLQSHTKHPFEPESERTAAL